MNRFFHKLTAGFLFLVLTTTLLFGAVHAEGENVLPSQAPYPELACQSACLIDAHTGTVLYSKSGDERAYPASTTKVMTALVVLENCTNLNDIVTFSDAAVYGIDPESSKIGAYSGEQLTVEQALYGLLLKSGNDCAVALAEYIAGSEAAFADMMNAKAAEIGCTGTHFVNAHGLYDDNHYTTAHDMAVIMQAAIQNPKFVVIDSTYSYQVSSTNLRADGFPTWYMGCKMINSYADEYYEGVISGKTGFTDECGNTLVTYAKRGDTELICAIMKSNATHYKDTAALYDYGFGNYKSYNMSGLGAGYAMDDAGYFSSLKSYIPDNSISISPEDESWIILPNEVSADQIQVSLDYATEESSDDGTIAYLIYSYESVPIGRCKLLLSVPETTAADVFDAPDAETIPATETEVVVEEEEVTSFDLPLAGRIGGVAAIVIIIAALVLFLRPSARKRRDSRRRRHMQMQNRHRRY